MAKKPDNSGAAAAKKPRGRPFQPGQSGNPGGRKPVPKEVKDMLQAATKDAAKLLIDTVNSPDARPDLRVRCAEIILDRVYGKPTQPIDGALTVEKLPEITEDEAKKALEALGYERK